MFRLKVVVSVQADQHLHPAGLPRLGGVRLVEPDPVERHLPPHEDLEVVLPVGAGPDGRGPVGVVVSQDVVREVVGLQGGAGGEAGVLQLERVRACGRGDGDLGPG